MKKKITITLDEDVFKNFKQTCADKGMKVSTRVNVLIRNDCK